MKVFRFSDSGHYPNIKQVFSIKVKDDYYYGTKRNPYNILAGSTNSLRCGCMKLIV